MHYCKTYVIVYDNELENIPRSALVSAQSACIVIPSLTCMTINFVSLLITRRTLDSTVTS